MHHLIKCPSDLGLKLPLIKCVLLRTSGKCNLCKNGSIIIVIKICLQSESLFSLSVYPCHFFNALENFRYPLTLYGNLSNLRFLRIFMWRFGTSFSHSKIRIMMNKNKNQNHNEMINTDHLQLIFVWIIFWMSKKMLITFQCFLLFIHRFVDRTIDYHIILHGLFTLTWACIIIVLT